MLRTTLAKAHLKRTIRPLYGWTQATPQDRWLDPAWDRSVNIYPGMGMTRAGGDLVTLPNAVGDEVVGLAGLYVGSPSGDDDFPIDEVEEQGINAFPVWTLGPDALFEILAPAFDADLTWTDPTGGTVTKVHVQTTGATRGKLVPAGTSGASTKPIARLDKVVSSSKIIIGGLHAGDA